MSAKKLSVYLKICEFVYNFAMSVSPEGQTVITYIKNVSWRLSSTLKILAKFQDREDEATKEPFALSVGLHQSLAAMSAP